MKQFFIGLFIFSSTLIFAQKDPYLIKNINTPEEVNAICYLPDGKKILAGFIDGSAKIIDLESNKTEVKVEGHWKGILAVDYDPKGKYFITAGDNRILVWTPEGELIYPLRKHTTTIFTADIHPEGRFMISGSISNSFKKWDVLEGKFLEDISGHTGMAMAVTYSPDGGKMASGSSDHTVKIWDSETHEEIMNLQAQADEIYSVAFSPDGKYLASCSKDKTIRIFDLEKGELYKILTGHKGFVMDIEFAPDNLHLVSCSFDAEVRIWEIPTGKNLYSFIDHEAQVIDVAFAPDGKSFATASRDKSIKIWDYNPEIFVDFYFSDQVIAEMEEREEFLPRQKGESKSLYQERSEKAAEMKKEIYREYYQMYLEQLKNSELPGMKE